MLTSLCSLQTLFHGSLPHPVKDIDYSSYQISSLLPGVDFFSDPFRCSATVLLSSLHLTAQELVKRSHFLSSLPILTLYEYFSHHVCRSIQHAVLARVYRLRCLSHLQLFAEAVKLLKELLTGSNLPQLASQFSRTHESHLSSLPNFANHLALDDPHNLKIASVLVNKSLSGSLREVYSERVSREVVLAQAELFVLLASSSRAPTTNILTRTVSAGHAPTSLSSISSRLLSSHQLSSSDGSREPTPAPVRRSTMLPLSTPEVKLLLLEAAEKLVYQLAQETESKTKEEEEGESRITPAIELL